MPDNQKHSQYGGSVIKRVIECPGSVALCASVPKRSSSYADEGTWAHALGAYCLEQGHLTADAFKAQSLPLSVEVPLQYSGKPCEPLIPAVNTYLAAVYAELALTDSAELYVEHDFELAISTAEPGEVFGRNDALVYHPETGRLRVFDYKHGAGVAVEVNDNAQLKFYLAGALFQHPEWKVRELILTIVQPRALDMDERGPVKDFVLDPVELFEFLATVEEAVAKAKDAETYLADVVDGWTGAAVSDFLKTGDHCRWCDAAAVCPLRERQALSAAQLDFKDVAEITARDLPEPKTLDVERLSKVVAGLAIVSAWQAQCQEYLEGLVMSGVEVPGWKAVEKMGRAKWVDDQDKIADYVELMLGVPRSEILPPRLVTITEAEKILKAAGADKDAINTFKLAFTVKESSGLTIAPESDSRPAVNAVARDFAHVQPVAAVEVALKAAPGCCEEASPASHTHYIPCNQPATRLVKLHDAGPYRMCDACADHNVRNRGGKYCEAV